MKTIKKGSTGSLVKQWQYFLIGQGYKDVLADGDFGPVTEKATKAFQKKNGLKADGVAGHFTFTIAATMGFLLTPDVADVEESSINWPPKPDFKPLSGNAARQALFGKFAYKVHADSTITVTDSWEANNIVSVALPQLAGVKGAPKSGKVRFHQLAAAQLENLFAAWEKAGLTDRILTWDGSYVPRLVRGSKTSLSNHAFGTAFDINVQWNFLGMIPARKGEKGSVRELVKLANKHGFYWGGHFTGRLDGMHFEIAKLLS